MKKSSINDRRLIDFFQAGTIIKYKKGEIIIRPEDTPRGVHLVKSGFIKSYSISKTGQISVRVIKKKGNILPIVWSLTGISRDVYMEAMNDVVLYRVSRSDFTKFVDETPGISKHIINDMVELYLLYDARIANLEYRYAYDRIIAQLLLLAKQFGKKQGQGVLIDLPIRHHDIADLVNATRETVSRELAKMERKKLISYKDRKIIIKSMSAFEAQL